MLLASGTKADFIKRVKCPKLGALALLEKGQKPLFWESLKALETWGEWDLIYDLCRQALRMGVDGVTTPFFVCDWVVWKRFVTAASKSATPERFVTTVPDQIEQKLTPRCSALEEVQAILKQYFAIDTKTAAMYKKNLSVALLETTFQLPGGSQAPADGPKGMTPRVVQIGLFLQQYFDKLSAFEDVKACVADLSFEEAKTLMEEIVPKLLDGVSFAASLGSDTLLTVPEIRQTTAVHPQVFCLQAAISPDDMSPNSLSPPFCSGRQGSVGAISMSILLPTDLAPLSALFEGHCHGSGGDIPGDQ